MEKNYNIKINPPVISSESINRHKDFDALFAKFKQTESPSIEQKKIAEAVVAPSSKSKISSWLVKYGVGAIVTIVSAVLVVFMIQQVFMGTDNVLPTNQIEGLLTLEEPLPSLQKEFSSLLVNSAELGEILIYHSGSKIIIPASAFVDKDGKNIKGKVEIQYREFDDYVDMFLAGVPKNWNPNQNLQLLAMMEIKAFQDGQAVYLGADKSLKIELKNQVSENNSTANLGIYTYNKTEDTWQYKTKDIIELPIPNPAIIITKDSEASLLKQAEEKMLATKPAKPIKPGIPTNMETFDFDIDLSQFREFRKYNRNVIFMAKANLIPESTFDTVWNSIKLVPMGDEKYQMELTFETSKGNIVREFEVYPALEYSKSSEKQYKKELQEYEKQYKKWTSDILAAVEQMKVQNEVKWVDIVHYFSINQLGLWASGKLVEIEDNPKIEATFIDENGLPLEINKLFVMNKDKSLYYSVPTKEGAKMIFGYDILSQNSVWALTPNKELFLAQIDKTIVSETTNYSFEMRKIEKIETEKEWRDLLFF